MGAKGAGLVDLIKNKQFRLKRVFITLKMFFRYYIRKPFSKSWYLLRGDFQF